MLQFILALFWGDLIPLQDTMKVNHTQQGNLCNDLYCFVYDLIKPTLSSNAKNIIKGYKKGITNFEILSI